MPLYYKPVTGSTVDVSTLHFAMETMQGMGIDVESCRMDAGYTCGSNLDMFYDEILNGIFLYNSTDPAHCPPAAVRDLSCFD